MNKQALQELFVKYPFEQIADRFKKSNENLEFLLNYSLKDFVVLSTRLKDYYSNVKDYFVQHKGESQLEDIRNKFLSSINELIVDLQFHDILRQKLEHMEHVHNSLIEEMSGLEVSNVDSTKFVSILPEISVLHTGQLTHLKGEYDVITNNIKGALQNIIEQKAAADALGFDSRDSIKHAEEFTDVVDRLADDLTMINEKYIGDITVAVSPESLTRLEEIEKIYTMKSERDVFNKLFRGGVVEEEEDDIELF